jgi:cytochrome bd-type quinol oxidase subunit 2
MVQLSIVLFFGLFAVVEIYQSVKNVQLPMAVYLVLAIVLAIASNAATYFPTSLVEVSPEIPTKADLTPLNAASSPVTLSNPMASNLTLDTQDQKQIISSID